MLNKRQGSTILEVLIATLVVGTVLTAVAASLTNSIKNSSEAEYRKIATRLAQEGLEIVRKEKYIHTWIDFKDIVDLIPPNGVWQCMNTESLAYSLPKANITDCTPIPLSTPPTSFYRGIQQTTTSDSVKVKIRVAWKDGDKTRDVVLEQTFREVVQ